MKIFDLLKNVRSTFALLAAVSYLNIVLFIFSVSVLIYHFIKLENLNVHFQNVRASLPTTAEATLAHAIHQFEWSHTFLILTVSALFIFSVVLPFILLLVLALLLKSVYTAITTKVQQSARLLSRPMKGRPVLSQTIEVALGLFEIWFDSRGGWTRLVAPLVEVFRREFETTNRQTQSTSTDPAD